MKTLTPLLLLSIFLMLALFFTSCQKDDEGTDEKEDGYGISEAEINTSGTNILAGEIVLLTAEFDFDEVQYDGTFGNLEIQLSRTENKNELVFIAPALPSDVYDLNFLLLNEDDLEKVIISFELETDENLMVGKILDEFQEQNEEHIQLLSAKASAHPRQSDKNASNINILHAALAASLRELDEQDRSTLAHFVHANDLHRQVFDALDVVVDFADSDVYPSDEGVRVSRIITASEEKMNALGTTFRLASITPEPTYLSKSIGLSASIIMALQHSYAKSAIAQFSTLNSTYVRYLNPIQADELVLNHRETLELEIMIHYKPMQSSHESLVGDFLTDLLESMGNIEDHWSSFRSSIQSNESWFDAGVPEFEENRIFLNQSRAGNYLGNPDYFRIENVGNFEGYVELELIKGTKHIALKATTQITTSLTFDLVFENPDLQYSITQKVEAMVSRGSACDGATFTDSRDGQTYDIVQIGNQCWFAENLNYEVSNSWCFDNNTANCDTYGRLYTFDASLTACPDGWHLASQEEWNALVAHLGGQNVAGGKMKSTTGWDNPNIDATNESGFSAISAGVRSNNGSYHYLGQETYFWSPDMYDNKVWYMLRSSSSRIFTGSDNLPADAGFSCRCIKD